MTHTRFVSWRRSTHPDKYFLQSVPLIKIILQYWHTVSQIVLWFCILTCKSVGTDKHFFPFENVVVEIKNQIIFMFIEIEILHESIKWCLNC